ncbi:TPA: hypothetical protein N0F65_005847 [Lagenidium giganteum]|uniref:Uncharacterized protein n=1 Tax=Lagenidium giganteum TaxID=4803 RepID=A0AAV2YRQ8_9STRA|nr:TPA: hypothetical protein N0F65_005847 [Lagenidium giganteum]
MRAVSSLRVKRVADAASAEQEMQSCKENSGASMTVVLVSRVLKVFVVVGVVASAMWVAWRTLGQVQVWMTSAGVMMVLMSVASAFQEVKAVKSSSAVFLEEEMESCGGKMMSLPQSIPDAHNHARAMAMRNESILCPNARAPLPTATIPAANSSSLNARLSVIPVETKSKPAASTPVAVSPTPSSAAVLNAASPAIAQAATNALPTVNQELPPTTSEFQLIRRKNSDVNTLNNNKMTVLHCGTVIDVQGSQGFIMPHDLVFAANLNDMLSRFRLPLAIPFDLVGIPEVTRSKLVVGQPVEFSYSSEVDQFESKAAGVRALNVTPLSSPMHLNEDIMKSRNALLTCKQAREESFARAMDELKMISPRHEPVKHHVDLIKYAEHLDDDAPLDLFLTPAQRGKHV